MIRFRLKELMADKGFKEERRITMDEVSKETGIHRTTLSKIANQKGYVTNTNVLDQLCTYFGYLSARLRSICPSQQMKATQAND